MPESVRIDDNQPEVGRFPRGEHVHNVLDDHVDRALLRLSDYPDSLIEAIDRVPYLASIAGRIIQLEGPSSLADLQFLDLIRKRLRHELLRRVITDKAGPAIEIIALLRGPVPRSILVDLANEDAVRETEDLGLVYPVFDRSREDLVAGIAVLHSRTEEHELEERDPEAIVEGRQDTRHRKIAQRFKRLYREDGDPRWIRECYYHTLATGDPGDIGEFGAVYRGELFWAGEYWFAKHNYPAALAAFQAARKLGLNSYESELRLAACLFRVGRTKEGEQHYRSMLERFPDARGVKTSFVDCYLALNRNEEALKQLDNFDFDVGTSYWIAHQFGRAYLGLHRYTDAISAFEAELKQLTRPTAYLDLAAAYRRIGRRSDVARVLRQGLKRYAKHFRLRVNYGCNFMLMYS